MAVGLWLCPGLVFGASLPPPPGSPRSSGCLHTVFKVTQACRWSHPYPFPPFFFQGFIFGQVISIALSINIIFKKKRR